MQDLMEIVALLRDPVSGCPWDKAQTHASIRQNFLEETYEAVDAIDLQDAHLLCEELGDVLLQVALHTQMEQEQNSFSLEDITTGVCQKLVLRHPHIFGEVVANDADTVLDNWEAIKRTEKGRTTVAENLDSVPAALPALMRARKVQKRAIDHIPSHTTALQAIESALTALQELKETLANDPQADATAMLGDALFETVHVARLTKVDPEQALSEKTSAYVADVKAQAKKHESI